MNLQEYVDSQYPPTMTFKIDNLAPTGVLADRVQRIVKACPQFFSGERFLDVGCAKGFFSLLAAKRCKEVVAIDCKDEPLEVCRELKKIHKVPNLSIVGKSFRNFIAYEPFDRIMLGNVAHHLFMEVRGWEWIGKLAAYSSGTVVVEGPLDSSCKDMREYVPQALWTKFDRFHEEMSRFFSCLGIMPSVSYTPDRYVMVWGRRPIRCFSLDSLPVKRMIKTGDLKIFETELEEPKKSGWLGIPKRKRRCVAKIINVPEAESLGYQMRFRIAASSPYSNGLVGEIYEEDAGKYCGFLEEYCGEKPVPMYEREKECFRLHCLNQIYLSKLGYVDVDSSMINVFSGSMKIFDKSQVFPLQDAEHNIPYYPILLKQSFKTIPDEVCNNLWDALKTRDPSIVEKAYAEVVEKRL